MPKARRHERGEGRHIQFRLSKGLSHWGGIVHLDRERSKTETAGGDQPGLGLGEPAPAPVGREAVVAIEADWAVRAREDRGLACGQRAAD